MRVVLFTHSLGQGGAERVAVDLAGDWAENGLDVTLVTITGSAGDAYGVPPGVRRVALKLDGVSAGWSAAIAANWRRVAAVRDVLLELRPDAAVAFLSVPTAIVALAALRIPEIALIGAERTHPPQLPLGPVWERLRRWAYRRLDALVVLTEETRQWVAANVGPCRVEVIPNGVALPLSRTEPMLPPYAASAVSGRKRLLAVGRLSEEKRFSALLRIFANLAPSFPDWDLFLVGAGPERRVLEDQVAELGMTARVYLIGRVGNVGDWYAQADAFALVSRFEGFPNALLEAMAHGVAAVSVDCDTGPRDLIIDGQNGLLVEPGDDAKLESALSRVMSDEALRRRLGSSAREVTSRFSAESVRTRWRTLIAEVVES